MREELAGEAPRATLRHRHRARTRVSASHKEKPLIAEGLNADCQLRIAAPLPSPSLQHIFLLQAADGEALHRGRHIFADFK